MTILIKNASVISKSLNGTMDLLIEDERIVKIGKEINCSADRIINAKNKLLIPGLIDMHVHLREPGFEHRETLKTGLLAALHGGVTTVGVMPNTNPPIDNPALIYYLKNKAKDLGYPNLEVIASVTKGRSGKELSEMISMSKEGAIAFSDDGSPIYDPNLMLKALEYSKLIKKPIINHCEVLELSQRGYMREGKYSNFYGIYGIPDVAESIMVARDIQLADYTGANLHIAHVSCKKSLDLIRSAKNKGLKVSCEVTHNHLLFTDEDLKDYSTFLKVNPPLPTKNDLESLVEAIKDGTIDIIVSDHAPYAQNEKEMEFQRAPYGISGLETLLSGILLIHEKYSIPLKRLVEMLTYNPAKLFDLRDRGDIKKGYLADLVLLDKDRTWLVTDKSLLSKGKNTPFLNYELPGVVLMTMVSGKIKYTGEGL